MPASASVGRETDSHTGPGFSRAAAVKVPALSGSAAIKSTDTSATSRAPMPRVHPPPTARTCRPAATAPRSL